MLVTSTVTVVLQPVCGLVTFKVYMPGTETMGFCKVEVNPLGPVQRYVQPEMMVFPLSCTVGCVASSMPPMAVTGGGVLFCLMSIFFVSEQVSPA